MNLRTLLVSVTVASLPFAASALTLDDFSVDQLVGDDEFEGVVNTNTTTGTLFDRTLTVDNRSDDPLTAELESGFSDDALDFANDPSVEGIATVDYAVNGVNVGSLGSAFEIDLLFFDLPDKDAEFSITVNGSDTVSTTFDQGDVGSTLVFAFSSFVDLSSVSTLSFSIDAEGAPALDVTFDDFRIAPIPVPAAGFLLLGGLGALGAMRRRKQKTA